MQMTPNNSEANSIATHPPLLFSKIKIFVFKEEKITIYIEWRIDCY